MGAGVPETDSNSKVPRIALPCRVPSTLAALQIDERIVKFSGTASGFGSIATLFGPQSLLPSSMLQVSWCSWCRPARGSLSLPGILFNRNSTHPWSLPQGVTCFLLGMGTQCRLSSGLRDPDLNSVGLMVPRPSLSVSPRPLV